MPYTSVTRAAITEKIINVFSCLFNAYSYHVILLKVKIACFSNSAAADTATLLEGKKDKFSRYVIFAVFADDR